MHGTPRGHFRAHDRLRLRLDVSIEGPHGAPARRARMIDTSLGGAGLELDEALEAGDRIVLSIVTPDLWDPLRVGARVAWTAPSTATAGSYRVGCVFEHVRADDVRALWELLGASQ